MDRFDKSSAFMADESRSIAVEATPNNFSGLPVELQPSYAVCPKGSKQTLAFFVVNNWDETQAQIQARAILDGQLSIQTNLVTAKGANQMTAAAYQILRGSTVVASGMVKADVMGTRLTLPTGSYTIRFGSMTGYQTPADTQFRVIGADSSGRSQYDPTRITATYYTDRQSMPNVQEPGYGAIWTQGGYGCRIRIMEQIADSPKELLNKSYPFTLPARNAEAGVITLEYSMTQENVYVDYSLRVVEIFNGAGIDGTTGQVVTEVGRGGQRHVYICDSVYLSRITAAAAAAAAGGLSEADVNNMIATTLSALSLPEIGDNAIGAIIQDGIKDLQGLAFPLDIGLPDFASGALDFPKIEMPTLGAAAPQLPDLELTVAEVKEMLARDPKELLASLGHGVLPDILIDFAFARATNDTGNTVWMRCVFPKEFASPPTVTATCEFRQGWYDNLNLVAPKLGMQGLSADGLKKMFLLTRPITAADWSQGDGLDGPYTHQDARLAVAQKYGFHFASDAQWTNDTTGATLPSSCYVRNSRMWETEADWLNRQYLFTVMKGVTLNLPDPAILAQQLQAAISAKIPDPTQATKTMMKSLEDQTRAKIKSALGSWGFNITIPVIDKKIGISLNGLRDVVVAAAIIGLVAVIAITAPGPIILIAGVSAILIALIVKVLDYVNSLAKMQMALTQKVANAQAQANAAIQGFVSDMGGKISQFSSDLSAQNLAAMNTMAEHMTGQAQAALNSVITNLYNGSDLPAMKLPVVAVRNVSAKDCEVLVPKGATVNLWIIGKVKSPLEGFMARSMAQMNEPGLWEQLKRLLPGGA